MRLRRLAVIVLLVVAGGTGAQPPRAELPPLLTPPAPASGPLAPLARGPVGEYDHAHLYLPEYRPAGSPEPRGLLARWRARRGEPTPPRPGLIRWPAATTAPRD